MNTNSNWSTITALAAVAALIAAGSAPAQQYTPEEWVQTIQQQADEWHQTHTEEETVKNCGASFNKTNHIRILYKGYTERRLSSSDVNALWNFRINKTCEGGTGDFVYLPSVWQFHPYMDNPLACDDAIDAGGYLYVRFQRASIGKPYMDAKLKRFEAVLASPDYRDTQSPELQINYYLQPQGKMSLIEPMTYYESSRVDGQWRVRAKPSNVEFKSGENPDDFVRLSDIIGQGRPVLIGANDPADYQPMVHLMSTMEYLYQAYKSKIAVYMVATGPTDWVLKGNWASCWDYMTGPNAFKYDINHAWSNEEKARRMMNRYIQFPNVTFPTVMDNMGQTFKHHYGAFGGSTHYILIDAAGTIVRIYKDNLLDRANVDSLEQAIEDMLANGGTVDPAPYKGSGWDNELPPSDEIWMTGVITAVDKSTIQVRRHDHAQSDYVGYHKKLTVEDAGGRLYLTDKVQASMEVVEQWLTKPNHVYTVDPGTRIRLNGRVASAGDLEVGDIVGIRYPKSQESGGTLTASRLRAARLSGTVGTASSRGMMPKTAMGGGAGNASMRVSVYTPAGRLVCRIIAARMTDAALAGRLTHLGEGTYVVRMSSEGCMITRQIAIR